MNSIISIEYNQLIDQIEYEINELETKRNKLININLNELNINENVKSLITDLHFSIFSDISHLINKLYNWKCTINLILNEYNSFIPNQQILNKLDEILHLLKKESYD